jgi:EAL domain-containing protein (putative c-di-GMP-specific phosphodiesterase class I)
MKEPKNFWYLENRGAGIEEEWSVQIKSTPFVMGRTEDNDLVLRAKPVSRHHAEINLSGELLWIRDLKSTNGTYVNYKKIAEATEIREGDIVNIGRIELVVKKDVLPVEADSFDETCMLDMTEELKSIKQAAEFKPRLMSLLENHSVVPHYQSIVDINTSEVAGYEILGRISKDTQLPANLEELFEISSFFNLAPELSSLFRIEGVRVQEKLPKSCLLFMNTHPSEMNSVTKLEKSLNNLRRMAPETTIVMEIHERSIQSVDTLKYVRRIFSELDIKLAYDDFGVGETRLVELARVPPDFLKFDISIIKNIHLAPPRLHQMVKTFVDASKDLGIVTLAEGIEKREECQKCRELGFELGQGFYYSMPLQQSGIVPDSRNYQ